jgi:hypothetical protein
LHGLNPEAREIVRSIDPMMKPGSPGGGSGVPKIKLKEYNPKDLDRGSTSLSPLTNTYGGKYSFQFVGEDNKTYGVIHVTPIEHSKSLHVDFIEGTNPENPHEYRFSDKNSFESNMPAGYMLQVLRQLKERFPEMTSIEGNRISGAKYRANREYSKTVGEIRDRVPIKPGEDRFEYNRRILELAGPRPDKSVKQRIPLPELD